MALCAPAILRGLGVQVATGAVVLALEGQGEVALEPVRAPPHEPLPPQVGQGVATRRAEAWWTTVLAEERALYVQYNAVQAADGSSETLAEFAAGLPGAFERGGCERLVLDLRWNGGGDNTTFGPLIAALKDPRLDREGRLFALVGRHTFSAAGNFVTVLERDTRAILVGEPTGGAPNQYGDARDIRLPHQPGLLVRIATRYHAFGGAEDRRLSHEPERPVPLLAADSFGGRDPVLRAALEHGRK